MKLISIVFSFKDEEKNIPELVDRVAKAFKLIKNWSYELIFVNDASIDSSEDVLVKLQSEHPITIINMSRNFGVASCVIAGFKQAKGDAIVYMDTDLQDPPELIEKLILEHENGADIVHTVRTKRLGESKIKMFVTKLGYRIINFFSDIDLQINAGDFKLISRRALDEILKLKEFRPYIRGLSVWVGFKQSIVYYVRDPRRHGVTHVPMGHKQVEELMYGITAYSLKPLYYSIIIGFVCILISIALMIHTFHAKFNELSAFGSASVLISISFFSGMIILSQGIIGIYIARIFEQVRGRKSYVIKDIKKPKDKI
ncbi:glycosyltransferase family 2 protein [Pelagibacteraceae bacterium]|nr:glycosyltransferase family 2 protein [Pelagibacteraceae bacterium]